MMAAFRRLSACWPRCVLLLLLLSLSGVLTSAASPRTSVLPSSSAGLALQEAALRAVEAISTVQQWKVHEQQVVLAGLEDVSVAETVKYDFKVRGAGSKSEGVEFTVEEEPSVWQEVGTLNFSEEGIKSTVEGKAFPLTPYSADFHAEAKLPDTDITGPVELWFHRSPNMRLALPHDVEAGPLSKVFIAEGATVTVVGASKISLARPLRLRLAALPSLDKDTVGAAGTAALLKNAASQSEKSLVSLVVIGATGLVSKPSPEQEEGNDQAEAARLKVRRLSDRALEVSSRLTNTKALAKPGDGQGWMWPLSSLSAGDERVTAIEAAVRGVAGESKAVDLLKVEASASRLVRMQVNLDVRLSSLPNPSDTGSLDDSRESHYLDSQSWEVLVRLTNRQRPEPLSAKRVGSSSEGTTSLSWSVATGNRTFVSPETTVLNTPGLMDLDV